MTELKLRAVAIDPDVVRDVGVVQWDARQFRKHVEACEAARRSLRRNDRRGLIALLERVDAAIGGILGMLRKATPPVV